jgi:hypothetical protein
LVAVRVWTTVVAVGTTTHLVWEQMVVVAYLVWAQPVVVLVVQSVTHVVVGCTTAGG